MRPAPLIALLLVAFSERTDAGQMYTYPDFTARFIWNFDDPDFTYPDPRINVRV
jgi:hypothetical protein